MEFLRNYIKAMSHCLTDLKEWEIIKVKKGGVTSLLS